MDKNQIRIEILRDIDRGTGDTKLFHKLGVDHDLWLDQVSFLVAEGYMTKPVYGDDTIYSFVGAKLTEKGERFLHENPKYPQDGDSSGHKEVNIEKLMYAILKRFSEGVLQQTPREFKASREDFIRAVIGIKELRYVTRLTLTKEPVAFLDNAVLTDAGKAFLAKNNVWKRGWHVIVNLAKFIRG